MSNKLKFKIFFSIAWTPDEFIAAMDSHSAGAVAMLGTVGAATGALSAVLVYAMCVRRRRFPMFVPGGGPLNWFEKDLLDRAKEAAAQTSDQEFIELGNVASGVACDSLIPRDLTDNINDLVEWERKDPPYDASILSSREGELTLWKLIYILKYILYLFLAFSFYNLNDR